MVKCLIDMHKAPSSLSSFVKINIMAIDFQFLIEKDFVEVELSCNIFRRRNLNWE